MKPSESSSVIHSGIHQRAQRKPPPPPHTHSLPLSSHKTIQLLERLTSVVALAILQKLLNQQLIFGFVKDLWEKKRGMQKSLQSKIYLLSIAHSRIKKTNCKQVHVNQREFLQATHTQIVKTYNSHWRDTIRCNNSPRKEAT